MLQSSQISAITPCHPGNRDTPELDPGADCNSKLKYLTNLSCIGLTLLGVTMRMAPNSTRLESLPVTNAPILTLRKLSNLLVAAAVMHLQTPTPKCVPKSLIAELIKDTVFWWAFKEGFPCYWNGQSYQHQGHGSMVSVGLEACTTIALNNVCMTEDEAVRISIPPLCHPKSFLHFVYILGFK